MSYINISKEEPKLNETTAVALVDKFTLPAIQSDMSQAYAEETAGLPQARFDRVKIPSGGGLAFEVPGDNPDNPESTDVAKEIVGIIIDHHPVNAYWAEKYSGANNPPDCSSMDNKMGIGNPGGPCEGCRFNQWGSGEDARSKACKNMHRIYILRDGEMIPMLLTLPPTSLRNLSDYIFKRILGKGRRSFEVLTKITLKKATSGGGITYSQAHFSMAGVLPEEVAKRAAALNEQIKGMTRSLAVMDDDLVEPTSPYDVPPAADDDENKDLPF